MHHALGRPLHKLSQVGCGGSIKKANRMYIQLSHTLTNQLDVSTGFVCFLVVNWRKNVTCFFSCGVSTGGRAAKS